MANGFMSLGLKQRIGLAVLEAGLVVAVLYFLGHRDWLFIGSIAAALALSALAPPRISGIVSGLSLIALAALFHFHFKMSKLPFVLGAVGVIFLAFGLMRFKIAKPRN